MTLGKITIPLALVVLSVASHPALAAEPSKLGLNVFSEEAVYVPKRCYTTDTNYAAETCLLPSKNSLHSKLENWQARLRKEEKTIYEFEIDKVEKWNGKVKEWLDFASNKNIEKDHLKVIRETNLFVNDFVEYRDDYSLYGKDVWATVIDTVNRGGDCEDMALLKAVALRQQGVPLEKMALVAGYVNYRGRRVAHAVLIVEVEDELYILDNLGGEIVVAREYPIELLYVLSNRKTAVFKKK